MWICICVCVMMNYHIDLMHVFYYTVDLLFRSQNIVVYKTGYENYFTETLLDANNSCHLY